MKLFSGISKRISRQIRASSFLLLFLAVLIPQCALYAQESLDRGVVTGVVRDTTGALVVGANVSVTNTDTSVVIPTSTNSAGTYAVRQLVPGAYKVVVKANGFESFEQSGIHLDAGRTVQVDVVLKAGSEATSITVTAGQDLLNTQEGANPSLIDTETLVTMPIPDNNPGLLIKLQNSIQSTDPIASASNGTIFANGGNSSFGVVGVYKMDEFTLDGAPNDIYTHQQNYASSADEVKEVNTEASGFDATVGHTLGGVMNVVSRNGTNQYHGDARYEYEDQRWQPLDRTNRLTYIANTAVPCEPPNENSAACHAAEAKYGQPGLHNYAYEGAVGGPVVVPHLIKRDKLFFFVAYMKDVFPLITTGQTTVPTSQELTGNFSDLPCPNSAPTSGNGTYGSPYVWASSAYVYPCPSSTPTWGWGQYQIYDPLTTVADGHGGFIRQPFSGNVIPSGRLMNPLGAIMAKEYLSANTATTNGASNLTYARPRPQQYYSISPRIDFALSQSDHFFYHQAIGHYQVWNPDTASVDNLAQYYSGRFNLVVTGGWDHTFSPRLTMNTTLSYNRYNGPFNYPNTGKYSTSTSEGLPAYLDAQAGTADFAHVPISPSINSYDSLTYTGSTLPNFTKTDSINVDLVGVFRNHVVKFGGTYRIQVVSDTNPASSIASAATNGNDGGTLVYDNTYTGIASDATSYISTGASQVGPAYAEFLMGFNTSATQFAGTVSDKRSDPYMAFYVQDAWRVTPRLTINAGLRFEEEWGPVEALNHQLGPFDPTQTLSIAPGAQAAYAGTNYSASSTSLAAAGLPSSLPSTLTIQGGSTFAGVNGVSNQQWQNSLRYMPRLAAAYQINPKTVVRAGYGMFYDGMYAFTLGNDQTGYSVTTSQPSSLTNGTSWVASGVSTASTSPTLNPFPNGFAQIVGSAPGNLLYAGGSQTYTPQNLVPARQQRAQVSIQRQTDANSVLTVSYTYALTNKIATYGANGANGSYLATVGVNLNPVPASYYTAGQTPATAQTTALNASVANPFYIGNLTGLSAAQQSWLTTGNNASFFNSKTVALNQLLKPYPHLSGLTGVLPVGESRFNAIEVDYSRRFTSSFNININYQRTFQYDRDWFTNPFDQLPTWEDTVGNSRPSRLAGTGVWKLPFGRGQRFANQNTWEDSLIGKWQLDASYEVQQGALIVFPNAFYSGCTTSWQSCDTTGLKEKHPSYGEWFNTTGFNTSSVPATYNLRVFPHVVDGVRSNGVNDWSANLQKTIPIREHVNFEMRLEAMDLFNHLVASAPNTTPTSAQFGQVTSDAYAVGRWVQIQGRINF
jgi:hypothetical protein